MESKHRVGPRPFHRTGRTDVHATPSTSSGSTPGPRSSALALAGQTTAQAESRPLAGRTVVFGPVAGATAIGRRLGAELSPSAFARFQAEVGKSPELADFYAHVEGRPNGDDYHTNSRADHVLALTRRLIALLGGPAIRPLDLKRLLYPGRRWHGSDFFRLLVRELGGPAISPELLHVVLDACLESAMSYGHVDPELLARRMADLRDCGLLSGPQQEVVLAQVLKAPCVDLERSVGHLLAHLVPTEVLDTPARERWEADVRSACTIVARSQASLDPMFRHLASRLIAGGQPEALATLWRAAERCARTVAAPRAAEMAGSIAFAHRDLESALRKLLSAGFLSSSQAMLVEACMGLLRKFRDWQFWRPLSIGEVRRAIVDSSPSQQLAVWLAWHGTAADDGRASGTALPDTLGLDAPDLSDRGLCLRLLDDPLCALSHPALEGLNRFEALATACAVRRTQGRPDPDLDGAVPAALRDVVLLRLPSIAPWTLSPQRLVELHAHFMARIRADPGWMDREPGLAHAAAPPPARDGKTGAAATTWPHPVDEVLVFYEGFLQAYGLHLAGREPFPLDPPGQAWLKAAELVSALRPLVRPPVADLHDFERGRREMFKSVLNRALPLLQDPELDPAIAEALGQMKDYAQGQAAFEALSRRFAVDAADPARVVRQVLTRCESLGDKRLPNPQWTVAAAGLLQPFRHWPREDSRRVVTEGLVPPLLQRTSRNRHIATELLMQVEPIAASLGADRLALLDAALDPLLDVDRWARFDMVHFCRFCPPEPADSASSAAIVMRVRVARPWDDPWLEDSLLDMVGDRLPLARPQQAPAPGRLGAAAAQFLQALRPRLPR